MSGLTATADPKVFSATFTANDAFTGTASVSVAAGSYTNAAGNAGTAGTDSVPVDTAAPVPTITLDAAITPDDIINATEAGQSIAITGVVGGDAKVGDTVTLTVNGKDFSGTVVSTAGVLGFSIAVPGADLVADSDATIQASVTTTDAAGNSASATDTEGYSVNTGAPTVTVDIVDAALNVADKVSTVTFSFSEAPVGFTAADISAVGGTVSGLTQVDATHWTATFTAADAFTGTASVSVAAGSYTNAAGNAGTAGSDSVPVDTAAPVPTITLDASITPDDIINATEAGQSIAITGVVGGDAKAGDTVTLTVNGKDFSGSVVSTAGVLGFSIAVPGADLVADSDATIQASVTTTDAAGNSASATDTEGYSVNTGAPTVTVDIVDAALNVADKVSTVTFSFSEAPVGFTAADISAVGGTISGLTATADPKVFTATFTANDAFTGTASVSVAAGSYTNAAGNAGTAGTDSVPADTAPPVPTITLDANITPDDIINATEAGQSIAITGTVGGDAKAGDTVTLTVNGKDFSGTVVSTAGVLGFSIAVPGADLVADSDATIQASVSTTDAAGNSASATDTEGYSVNTGAPTVTVDIVDTALNVADKVSTVTFSFSEAPVGFTAADITAVGGTISGLTATADP
ncbi:Ig-like domain-containing protein, partial [Uliginosibacterium sp. IMCC34675]|nr:Ig-like domain-containing protein [Uliginosibacterium aquaticum]